MFRVFLQATGCAVLAAYAACAVAADAWPSNVINKLNSVIVKALNQADMKQRLAEQGSDPAGNSPAEFKQFIAAESEKWARIVKISGAKVD